jgi:acetylglutamate kinase
VNINADTIAMELAVALQAEKLIFFTNTDGIYHKNRLNRTLTQRKAQQLIDRKVIANGMKVKVENGLKALQGGVPKVHIINGLSRRSLLKEILTQKGIGTMLIK